MFFIEASIKDKTTRPKESIPLPLLLSLIKHKYLKIKSIHSNYKAIVTPAYGNQQGRQPQLYLSREMRIFHKD